jgi:phosphoribosylformimino-5-aminoimidazole carboxamide ribotide isomerase
MSGPAIELYRDILSSVPGLRLVASGGVSSAGDVDELERIGCSGVIIGRAIYEGKIKLEELSRYVG